MLADGGMSTTNTAGSILGTGYLIFPLKYSAAVSLQFP